MRLLSYFTTLITGLCAIDVGIGFLLTRTSTIPQRRNKNNRSKNACVVRPHVGNSSRINTSRLLLSGATKRNSGISRSIDKDYPYNFTGRLWFYPALVKVPPHTTASSYSNSPGSNVKIISLFGYTLGGSVCLEYDTSPVGPYREYVTMSALVMKRGAIGQWGSRLYVSTLSAEQVCRDIWGVPAELAKIDFVEEGETLRVVAPPNARDVSRDAMICVAGWKNTRILSMRGCMDGDNHDNDNEFRGHDHDHDHGLGIRRWGELPVYWTPTIKALWLPFIPFSKANSADDEETADLPLHRLRLSASAIRLHWSGFQGENEDEYFSNEGEIGSSGSLGRIPLGLGLVVDNVLIEIGTRCKEGL